MTAFIEFVIWLLLIICMVMPVSFAITASIGGTMATILSAMWGLACGVISMRIILRK